MPEDVVVGLNSLSLRGKSSKMGYVPILERSPERIFTEDEIKFLHSLSTEDLWRRYRQGEFLVSLFPSPDIMNMTKLDISKVASNLRYQMDVIMSIIRKRTH